MLLPTRIVLPWVTRTRPPSSPGVDAPAGEISAAGRSSANRSVRPLFRLAKSLSEEPLVGRPVVEVAAAAQHQGLIDRLLESVMALFGISVLVGLAGVDGLSHQAVVGQQGAVSLLEQSRSPRLFTAAVSRSVRWRRGTPPSSHRAFWSPWLRLSKLSEKQTVPLSQLE